MAHIYVALGVSKLSCGLIAQQMAKWNIRNLKKVPAHFLHLTLGNIPLVASLEAAWPPVRKKLESINNNVVIEVTRVFRGHNRKRKGLIALELSLPDTLVQIRKEIGCFEYNYQPHVTLAHGDHGLDVMPGVLPKFELSALKFDVLYASLVTGSDLQRDNHQMYRRNLL